MNEILQQMTNSDAQTVIAAAALISSIAIPLILYQGQKRRETLEFIQAVRSMWVSIDTVVLQSDDLIEAADAIIAPGAQAFSVQERRQTWMAMLILNAVYMDYLGAINGFHPKLGVIFWSRSKALEPIRELLKTYVQGDLFYELSQSVVAYDKEFRDLCREMRKSQGSPA